MRLDTKAMAISSGLLWGGAILAVGLLNVAKPDYGKRFLRMVGSIYPGYHATSDPTDIAVGTAYALLDGAVGGAVFSLLYNTVASSGEEEKKSLIAA